MIASLSNVVQPSTSTEVELSARRDNLELLIGALLDEASVLVSADRETLIERVLAAGGYECVEGPPGQNERARMAMRIAARLAD
jgi:hypothetical protein